MPNYYQQQTTNEIRILPPELIAAWQAAGNPKLADYILLPPQPSPEATWQNGEWFVPSIPEVAAGEV